jgi:hypothetical protein
MLTVIQRRLERVVPCGGVALPVMARDRALPQAWLAGVAPPTAPAATVHANGKDLR